MKEDIMHIFLMAHRMDYITPTYYYIGGVARFITAPLFNYYYNYTCLTILVYHYYYLFSYINFYHYDYVVVIIPN